MSKKKKRQRARGDVTSVGTSAKTESLGGVAQTWRQIQSACGMFGRVVACALRIDAHLHLEVKAEAKKRGMPCVKPRIASSVHDLIKLGFTLAFAFAFALVGLTLASESFDLAGIHHSWNIMDCELSFALACAFGALALGGLERVKVHYFSAQPFCCCGQRSLKIFARTESNASSDAPDWSTLPRRLSERDSCPLGKVSGLNVGSDFAFHAMPPACRRMRDSLNFSSY